MNAWFSERLAPAVRDFDGFTWGLSGSQFLALYALWFGLVFGLVVLLQRYGRKNLAITIIGLAGYEIPGVLRMTIFAPPYMHDWSLLVAAMFLGGGAFWWRIRRRASGK